MGLQRLLLLLAILACVAQIGYGWGNKDRVRLTDVQTLTLRRGEWTAGRRSSPVPQLSCVGGNARGRSGEVDVVQCHNKGSDGYGIFLHLHPTTPLQLSSFHPLSLSLSLPFHPCSVFLVHPFLLLSTFPSFPILDLSTHSLQLNSQNLHSFLAHSTPH